MSRLSPLGDGSCRHRLGDDEGGVDHLAQKSETPSNGVDDDGGGEEQMHSWCETSQKRTNRVGAQASSHSVRGEQMVWTRA